MSALDLDALEARCKDTIAEWTLVYAQSGETLPDDAVETKAARETLALITRLRAAESEASSAGVLRCKLTHEEAQTEAAGRALEMVAPGLLAEHGAIFSAVLELGARLRAAEARTAWQPIETAPRADDDAPPWVLGLYVGGHVYAVMPLRSGGWMDMDGNRRHAPIARAPLPAIVRQTTSETLPASLARSRTQPGMRGSRSCQHSMRFRRGCREKPDECCGARRYVEEDPATGTV
jgi:hypothetical protein